MTATSQEATLFDMPRLVIPMETHEDLIIIFENKVVLNQSYTTAQHRLEALVEYLRTNPQVRRDADDKLCHMRQETLDPNTLLRALSLAYAKLGIGVHIDTRMAPETLPTKVYSIITRSDNPGVALTVQHFVSANLRTGALREQAEKLGILVRLSASDNTIITSLAGALTVINDAPTHLTLVAADRHSDGSAGNDGSLRHDPTISVTTTTISAR